MFCSRTLVSKTNLLRWPQDRAKQVEAELARTKAELHKLQAQQEQQNSRTLLLEKLAKLNSPQGFDTYNVQVIITLYTCASSGNSGSSASALACISGAELCLLLQGHMAVLFCLTHGCTQHSH